MILLQTDYQSAQHESLEDVSETEDFGTGYQEHEMFKAVFSEGEDNQGVDMDMYDLVIDNLHIGTLLFLETPSKMRGEEEKLKLKLWKEISEELCKKGYLADAEKCRQKFANLSKKYVEFVRHGKQTGKEKNQEPASYCTKFWVTRLK
ncbi:unnamed protein product [Phaedon cochleariae]|uniref:Myb/SANT-like DNA-binding domain-containing protein n=1 Tax=Phaedon cochleariae TaxID=80249 RepID=A0A9N9SCK1_PHACE|nr:unnamed protein product [Phaedon cochleariae]